MTIVVDASVAAKWLIAEADSPLARRLHATDMVAPSIFPLECAAALVRRLRMGQLEAAEVLSRLREVPLLPVSLHPFDQANVFDLAVTLRHPVYDCAYLSLALSMRLSLVTADRRLREVVAASPLASNLLPLVTMLADYA